MSEDTLRQILDDCLRDSNADNFETMLNIVRNYLRLYREKHNQKSNVKCNSRLCSRLFGPEYFRYKVDHRWRIQSDESKGRYAVAADDIAEGTVLLMEKPYSSVLTERCIKQFCNYCLGKITDNPYACEHCNEAVFCNSECFAEAYSLYHRFECGFLGVLYKLGEFSIHVYRILSEIGLENALEYGREVSNYSPGDFMKQKSLQTKSKLNHSERMELYRLSTSLIAHKEINTRWSESRKSLNLTLILVVRNLHLFQARDLEQNFYTLFRLVQTYTRRVSVNAFRYVSNSEKCASCLYSLASFINHSCDPNLNSDCHNGYIVFTANRYALSLCDSIYFFLVVL